MLWLTRHACKAAWLNDCCHRATAYRWSLHARLDVHALGCQSRAARGRLRAVVSLQKLPQFLQCFCNCGAEVGPTEPRSLNGVRLNLLAEIKGHGLRGNYSRPPVGPRTFDLDEKKNSNVERCAWALQKSSTHRVWRESKAFEAPIHAL